MIPAKSSKLMMWSAIFATLIGLSACQKETPEEPEPVEEPEVMMSAEPAEDNTPIIVADDLDEVDAQSELAELESDLALDIGLEPSTTTPPEGDAMPAKPTPRTDEASEQTQSAAPEASQQRQPKSDQ